MDQVKEAGAEEKGDLGSDLGTDLLAENAQVCMTEETVGKRMPACWMKGEILGLSECGSPE